MPPASYGVLSRADAKIHAFLYSEHHDDLEVWAYSSYV